MQPIKNYAHYYENAFLSTGNNHFNSTLTFLLNNPSDRSPVIFELMDYINANEHMFDYLFSTPFKYKIMRNKHIIIDFIHKRIIISPYFQNEKEAMTLDYTKSSNTQNYSLFNSFVTHNLKSTPYTDFLNRINNNSLLFIHIYFFHKNLIDSNYNLICDINRLSLSYKEPIQNEIKIYFDKLLEKADPGRQTVIREPKSYYTTAYKNKTKNVDFNENFSYFLDNSKERSSIIFRYINFVNWKKTLFDYVIYSPFNDKLKELTDLYVDLNNKKIILFPIFNSMNDVSNFDMNTKNNQIHYYHFENFLFQNLNGIPNKILLTHINKNPYFFSFVNEYYIKNIDTNKNLYFDIINSKLIYELNINDNLLSSNTNSKNDKILIPGDSINYNDWFTSEAFFEMNEFITKNLIDFPTNNFVDFINTNKDIFKYITNYYIFNDLLIKNRYLTVNYIKEIIYRTVILNPEEEPWGLD
jgi:hypothetical protein